MLSVTDGVLVCRHQFTQTVVVVEEYETLPE